MSKIPRQKWGDLSVSVRCRFKNDKFVQPYKKRPWTIRDAIVREDSEFLSSDKMERQINGFLQKSREEIFARKTVLEETNQRWEDLQGIQSSWSTSEEKPEDTVLKEARKAIGFPDWVTDVPWANGYSVRVQRKPRRYRD
jgi:hypothetical protein